MIEVQAAGYYWQPLTAKSQKARSDKRDIAFSEKYVLYSESWSLERIAQLVRALR
ncbi:MAG: hypothetical protein KME60_08505 [Cyanomargarita calcarea GSE-NOS-MK-12-04C]|uniref:Uncharacterized protein n=1 Tax=Cyanomargarita calcarea GSE-NOS-MK-12-04C TaxID=2839659 RepID=A0A951QL57_9CYAN|nr:hypothetical protein [Cyanomargarita calcarea GSE-NOS-MK-12-04C]